MTIKPLFALLAAGALTLAVSPATASPALASSFSAPGADLIQFGEDCDKGKCKGKKGEEAPARHAEVFATQTANLVQFGEDCDKGKCKGKKGDKGEEAPARHTEVFAMQTADLIQLGEDCDKGKCKGKDKKGEDAPA